jgi:hypothetical protein
VLESLLSGDFLLQLVQPWPESSQNMFDFRSNRRQVIAFVPQSVIELIEQCLEARA